MFEYLLLLFTPAVPANVPETYYVGVVAAEAAYVAMQPEKPVDTRVDRKDCKVCNGTGLVRSGDGQGWTKCANCKPTVESMKKEPEPNVPPAMRLQIRPLPGTCESGSCQIPR